MVAIKGHFDGRVLVPDEPVNLPANQRVFIHIQPIEERTTNFHAWLGQGTSPPVNPSPRFKTDDDLWE